MSWQATYENWKNFDGLEEDLKDNLTEIEQDQVALEDAFYTNLQFGTAGMRGIIGAGTW